MYCSVSYVKERVSQWKDKLRGTQNRIGLEVSTAHRISAPPPPKGGGGSNSGGYTRQAKPVAPRLCTSDKKWKCCKSSTYVGTYLSHVLGDDAPTYVQQTPLTKAEVCGLPSSELTQTSRTPVASPVRLSRRRIWWRRSCPCLQRLQQLI